VDFPARNDKNVCMHVSMGPCACAYRHICKHVRLVLDVRVELYLYLCCVSLMCVLLSVPLVDMICLFFDVFVDECPAGRYDMCTLVCAGIGTADPQLPTSPSCSSSPA
jgi:hypothetical protein